MPQQDRRAAAKQYATKRKARVLQFLLYRKDKKSFWGNRTANRPLWRQPYRRVY